MPSAVFILDKYLFLRYNNCKYPINGNEGKKARPVPLREPVVGANRCEEHACILAPEPLA